MKLYKLITSVVTFSTSLKYKYQIQKTLQVSAIFAWHYMLLLDYQ